MNLIDFKVNEHEKQIDLNVEIEEMINQYNNIQWKNHSDIKGCNVFIYNYLKKVKKYEDFKTDEIEQYARIEIFKETCKKSIHVYKNKIKDSEEKLSYELDVLKERIMYILNDAFVNGYLNKNTLIYKDEYTIYNVPSAKLRFKQLKPIIYDKKKLKLYLLECKLDDDYILDGVINWEKLKSDLEICEDNTIYLKEYGLIMNNNGIKLSNPELIIKFL